MCSSLYFRIGLRIKSNHILYLDSLQRQSYQMFELDHTWAQGYDQDQVVIHVVEGYLSDVLIVQLFLIIHIDEDCTDIITHFF